MYTRDGQNSTNGIIITFERQIRCSSILPSVSPTSYTVETQQFSTSIGVSAGYLYLLGNGERRDSIRLVFMFYLTVSRKRP